MRFLDFLNTKGLLSVITLVLAHRDTQFNLVVLKEVQLDSCRKIPLVPEQDTIRQLHLDIIEVINIMYRCRAQVKTLKSPTYRAHRM